MKHWQSDQVEDNGDLRGHKRDSERRESRVVGHHDPDGDSNGTSITIDKP